MVDIFIDTDDSKLEKRGILKGVMQLIDLSRANELYSNFGTAVEVSGGSGANTMVGLASLGLNVAYIGKVKSDTLGKKFKTDLLENNVFFNTPFSKNSYAGETGRCIVYVTPDGERSLNTYLGVTEYLEVADIDFSIISNSHWLYLEGYRLDGEKSELAFRRAIETAKKNSSRIALTLSDPFCVERNRFLFEDLVVNHTDLLFCNEAELKLLYETDNLEEAVLKGSSHVKTLACTVAEKGVIIGHNQEITTVPAAPVEVRDSNGAGDLFAAGFLFGMIKEKNIEICGKMGNLAASEIIGHLGARPNVSLEDLFQKFGF